MLGAATSAKLAHFPQYWLGGVSPRIEWAERAELCLAQLRWRIPGLSHLHCEKIFTRRRGNWLMARFKVSAKPDEVTSAFLFSDLSSMSGMVLE
jgi:hypothetical protein